MAIEVVIPGTKPEPFNIQNGILETSTASIPSDPVEICYCVATDCDRNLKVFASLTDNSERANDKTSFLYRVMSPSDTATIKLYKNDVEVAQLNTNTLGTYYPIGTFGQTNGITAQQLYVGYIVDWQSVLQNHGVGDYYIQADLTFFGAAVVYKSETYKLFIYTPDRADGSVKLTSYQNGNIESNPFDFTDMNWYQQIRIDGILWNKKSEYISDSYFTSNRTITQIQDSIEYTYDLQVEFVQDSVSKFIIENTLLANQIFVSDYNLTNTSLYNNIPLAVKEINDTTELYYYNGRSHVIQFTDRIQNIRKRNYK